MQMQERFGNANSVIECVLSANVVLSKTDEEGKSTYSLFFGEAYNDPKQNEDDDNYRGHESRPVESQFDPLEATQICKTFQCKNITKFNKRFPKQISHNTIFETFERAINESSDVNVYEVANMVAVFTMIAPTKRIKNLQNFKFGIPKIQEL